MLCEVVCKVRLPRLPIYAKLFLRFAVAEPVESHVHCFRAFWLNFVIYHAFRRQIVGLDWCSWLRVSHFGKDLSHICWSPNWNEPQTASGTPRFVFFDKSLPKPIRGVPEPIRGLLFWCFFSVTHKIGLFSPKIEAIRIALLLPLPLPLPQLLLLLLPPPQAATPAPLPLPPPRQLRCHCL